MGKYHQYANSTFYFTLCSPCTELADCQIILRTLGLKINESEWKRSSSLCLESCESRDYECIKYDIVISIVLLCVYCSTYSWMIFLCLIPVIVAKVKAGERAVVPKVELGEQRVNQLSRKWKQIKKVCSHTVTILILIIHWWYRSRILSEYSGILWNIPENSGIQWKIVDWKF